MGKNTIQNYSPVMNKRFSPLTYNASQQYMFINNGIGRTNYRLPYNASLSSTYHIKILCDQIEVDLDIIIIGQTEFITK